MSFDEYNDQVKLIYDGATLAFFNHSTLDDREWHAFQVSCDTGVFDVWLDGAPIITYDDSANFFARATGTLSGFAGGSGGETNAHQVRNMAAAVGATSQPAVTWAAPFARQAFNGTSDYTPITDAVIQSDTSLTVETWFRTNTGGTLFGYQADPVGGGVSGYYTPALYVATDGQLRGVFWSDSVGPAPITSAVPVSGDLLNDGAWHHVALIGDDDQSTLYIDGVLAGVKVGLIDHLTQAINQVGTGYTFNWPFGNSSWYYFGGEIGGFNVWDGPLSAAAVATIAATPPALPAVAYSTSTGVVTTYDGVDDYTVAPDDLIQSRAAVVEEGDVLRFEWITGAGYRLGITGTRRVGAVDLLTASTSIRVDARPHVARVLPNYPNPFNPETWLPFELDEASRVVVVIYDMQGRLVRTLELGQRVAGYHVSRESAAYWDGRNELGESVGSGVYFYELRAGSGTSLGSMTILK